MVKRGFKILAFTALAAAAGGAFFALEREPASQQDAVDFRVEVDISDRELTAIKNGEVVASYPVAVGSSEHPTPHGSYSVRHIVWNPRWVPPDSEWARDEEPAGPGDPNNPMGSVKIFFREPAYFIHGTRDAESLGRAASHGCIRMRNSNAIALAKMIMANGGSARPPSWYKRVLNAFRSTKEVYLSNSVPLTIQS